MPVANTDPSFLSAHRLAEEIAARRLSPVTIVEALLADQTTQAALSKSFKAAIFPSNRLTSKY